MSQSSSSSIPSGDHLERRLGRSLLDLYRQSMFGKASKPEIDLLVFATLARLSFRDVQSLWDADRFLWMRIEPAHLRRLSLELRITENRVSSLLEQAALLEGAESLEGSAAIAEIQHLASRYRQEASDLREGRLRLFIPNRYTRRAIEAFLSSNGAIPETSFHRDHLVIRVGDLLQVAAGETEEDAQTFLTKVVAMIADEDDQFLSELKATIDRKSGFERVKDLGKALTNRTLDHAHGLTVAGILGAVATALGG